jgi:hypothetical protein
MVMSTFGRFDARRRRRFWVAGLVVSLGFLAGGAAQLPDQLKAAHGQGTRGQWVAEYQVKGYWVGKFVLPNGTETGSAYRYDGSLGSVHPGTSVPALDTGDYQQVYPVGGSYRWIQAVIYMAAGAIGLIALAGAWIYLRWSRRSRA